MYYFNNTFERPYMFFIIDTLRKIVSKTAACGAFVYGGDSPTLEHRLETWRLERWNMVVMARKLNGRQLGRIARNSSQIYQR